METYKEAYNAQRSFDSFMDGLGVSDGSGRKDIPLKSNRKKKDNN